MTSLAVSVSLLYTFLSIEAVKVPEPSLSDAKSTITDAKGITSSRSPINSIALGVWYETWITEASYLEVTERRNKGMG